MAPRDYKNRSKPIPKKKTKQVSPLIKYRRIVSVAALVVMASVGGIVSAFQSSDHSTKVEKAAENNTATEQASKNIDVTEINMPAPPSKTDNVYDMLKHKEVLVELPKDKLARTPHLLQCASYTQLDNANRLKARIAKYLDGASITTSTRKSGKVWYGVRTNVYDSKRDAERARHLLQRNKIDGCRMRKA